MGEGGHDIVGKDELIAAGVEDVFVVALATANYALIQGQEGRFGRGVGVKTDVEHFRGRSFLRSAALTLARGEEA